MLWPYLAVVAYALNAVAFVIDKHLLSAPILRPISYAFWVGILSSVVVVLLPFGIYWVNFYYFLISFASGAAFLLALVLILRDYFSSSDVVAIGFMVVGILLIGKAGNGGIWREAIISGIAFGLSTVLLKLTFNNSTFLNCFFWTRMGLVGMALLMLCYPLTRREVSLALKGSSHSSRFVFLVNKIIAGLGFAILYVAIKLGNVSMVNALLSLQFVFIFFLALIFRNKIPGISENIKGRVFWEKLAGIIIVGAGLFIFFK